jgi:hypothetical protein
MIPGEPFRMDPSTMCNLIFSRNDVDPLVTGIPGNVHESFETRLEAECAYVLAYALGSVRVLQCCGEVNTDPAAAGPIPEDIMNAWAAAEADFLGNSWHVVFKGKHTGLFPS